MSGVPGVGSPRKRREFRHLTDLRVHYPGHTGHTGHIRYGRREPNGYFSNELRVGSSDLSWSGVLAVRSPGMRWEFQHLAYFNSVTIGAVQVIPDESGMNTGRVRYGNG